MAIACGSTKVVDLDALECAVLAYTLQPLVENAVRHGIAASSRGGVVRIAASVEEDQLCIVVADDGAGAPATVLQMNGAEHGVGIRAVTQRLNARYGSAASLHMQTAPGGGFRATITLPLSVAAVQRRSPVPVMQTAAP